MGFKKVVMLLALYGVAWTPSHSVVPANLFGVAILHAVTGVRTLTPLPPLAGKTWRMWDTGAAWADVNPADGIYNWTSTGFDALLAAAATNGVDLIYTIAKTPAWASLNPDDTECAVGGWSNGQCDPPSDYSYLNKFLTQIVARAAGRIKYWECWNEPNNRFEWNSTIANMVSFCENVYSTIKSIDPSLVLLTPPVNDPAWMTRYLIAGGGAYADIQTVHAYPSGPNPVEAEQAVQFAGQFSSLAAAYLPAGAPLWDTESSWSGNEQLTSATLQAAYVAKMYLIGYGAGFARRYFYAYDPNATNFAALWYNPGLSPPGITGAGVAYQQVQKWMMGATETSPVRRHAGVNRIRNTNNSGCIAGTPGTLPTHWSISGDYAFNGLIGSVIGCGSDSVGNYFDYRLQGMYTGRSDSSVLIWFEQNQVIAASAHEQWTLTCKFQLVGGSTINVSRFSTFAAFHSAAPAYLSELVYGFTPNPAPQLTTAWAIAPESTAWIAPALSIQYAPGAAIDFTLRIYVPTLDDGSVWSGTFSRPAGYQAEAIWDQNPTGGSIFRVPDWVTQYRDVTGATIRTGSVVTLTRSPILLENRGAL